MKLLPIFALFTSFMVFGQQYELNQQIELHADTFLGTDPYTNFYYIKDNVLFKNGPDGNLKFTDYLLGKIHSVDIINPLKIVVFYRDTNIVILLDNKLNEMERVNFNAIIPSLNISTATNAGDNKLWVFNTDTQQLELFNYRTEKNTVVSHPFPGLAVAQASNFNYCYVLTEKKLRAFNLYGSLLFEIDGSGYEKVVQQDNKLILLKKNSLYSVIENSINPIKIPLSENNIKDLHLTQDLLYIYDGNNILKYTLTNPKQ